MSVGVDTWGVDWALVDKAGELVGLPHAYRDPRNAAAYEAVVAKLGAERIYQTTGIQFMPLNSLYSLYAHKLADPQALAAADQLLFIPDLLHYWLSGERTIEATIASTSQMIDCHTGDWAREMLAELGLPTNILGRITAPGTASARCARSSPKRLACRANLQVVAPAAHDTASAVAAVPAVGEVPHEAGVICRAARGRCWARNSTSPASRRRPRPRRSPTSSASAARFAFLKNIPGLWLVQECRRDLARQGQELDYAALTRLASEAAPFRTLVDPGHASFQSPGGMLQKIARLRPRDESAGARVARRSSSAAASKASRWPIAKSWPTLESILGRRFDVIHIVGGGGKNALLSQMTADATGRRVVVGPYEATAMGNALVQAMAARPGPRPAALATHCRRFDRVDGLRTVVGADWDAAFERFQKMVSASIG